MVHGQGASDTNCSTFVFSFDVCQLSQPISSTNYGLAKQNQPGSYMLWRS